MTPEQEQARREAYLRQQAAIAALQQQGQANPLQLLYNLYKTYKTGKNVWNAIPTEAEYNNADFYGWVNRNFGIDFSGEAANVPTAGPVPGPAPAPTPSGVDAVPTSPLDPKFEQEVAKWSGDGAEARATAEYPTDEFSSEWGLSDSAAIPAGVELASDAVPAITAGEIPMAGASAYAPTYGADAALAEWGLDSAYGADAAASGAGTTGSTLAAASPYLGAAGAALGAYGIYNATQMDDKKKAALSGGLSGAGMGMGTAMLALGAANMWNPVGWALIGGGALAGAGLGGALAHKSTKQRQAERWQDLYEKDYTGGRDMMQFLQNEGNTREEWIQQQKALGAGEWTLDPTQEDAYQVNIMGKPNTVLPQMVWGEVAPQDLVGNDYFGKWNEQQRYEFNKQALERGLYEHEKGGFEFTDKDAAAALAQEIGAGTNWDDDWRANDRPKVLDDPLTAYDESKAVYEPPTGQPQQQQQSRPVSPPEVAEGPIINAVDEAKKAGTAWQQREREMATVEKPTSWQEVKNPAWGELMAKLGEAGEGRWNDRWGGAGPGTGPSLKPPDQWAPGSEIDPGFFAGNYLPAAPNRSGDEEWEKEVAAGRYRKGSARAGGYVDNRTNKWYASTDQIPT